MPLRSRKSAHNSELELVQEKTKGEEALKALEGLRKEHQKMIQNKADELRVVSERLRDSDSALQAAQKEKVRFNNVAP